MNSAYPILLFLAPFTGALLCAITGWWIRGAARWIALGALTLTAALSLPAAWAAFAAGRLHTHLGGWAPPIGIELALDPLSALMAMLVAWTALGVLAGSGAGIRTAMEGRETGFYALSLLLVCGLMGIVVTGDLFNLFVHLEVASLGAYALTASGRRGAARAGLNYLIVGSLGASLYLLGVGFLYAATGTLNMADLAGRLTEGPLTLTGAALITTGLAVKMALFPLHGWMPGAYAFAPPPAAALMAPLVTKVAAYALIRVLFWVYGTERLEAMSVLMDVLGWAGAAAIVAGGVLAFAQKDLWRLLAYSSVSQIGIVAVGVSVANTAGLTGAMLHIANDALMKAALFLAAGVALARFGVRTVDQLGALRGRAPWTIGVIIVAGVSLIGLPPLAGFFGKWHVLIGAVEAGRWGFAASIVLGTGLTAAYVFRILEPLLFAKHGVIPADAIQKNVREGSFAPIAAAVFFAAGIILLGLLNAPVVKSLVRAALPGGL